eukprot:4009495-Pleurochrysis_carterae.AAC.1
MVPACERMFGKRSSTSLFQTAGGAAWTSTDSRALARLMAAALGLDASEFAGKSFRIGGATDIRAMRGEEGMAVIQQRGRWGSERRRP